MLADTNATYTPGLSERRGSTSNFYHTDQLGNTRGITNSSQTATDSQLFDAWGMVVSRTGTTPTPFGFAGTSQYQTDTDSGLQLLGHRYYDPSTGRFITQDPARAGENWYAYCGNCPLNRSDPTGLQGVAGALKLGGEIILVGGGPEDPVADIVAGVIVGAAISIVVWDWITDKAKTSGRLGDVTGGNPRNPPKTKTPKGPQPLPDRTPNPPSSPWLLWPSYPNSPPPGDPLFRIYLLIRIIESINGPGGSPYQ